jgi:hypothetical protein
VFSTNAVIYGWIVLTVMLLKGWAINTYSSSQKILLIAATFYFVRYFPLHELTQLRAACGIGFLMVAATLLWKGNRLYGLLACAMALLFHMSVALLVPALLVQPTKRWHVITMGLGVFLPIFMGASFVSGYLGNYISVFSGYEELGFGHEAPNPFSVALVLDWAMIALALIKWNGLSLLMRRIVFLELVGMAIFYGALGFPVIAHRFREIFSVFWVFFVADGLRNRAVRLPTAGFVVASIVFYSYSFIFSGAFFH